MKDSNIVMSKNEFVKQEQKVMKSMMGSRPGAPAEMRRFNAYMSNNADCIDAAVKAATKGLDKDAFPVNSVE